MRATTDSDARLALLWKPALAGLALALCLGLPALAQPIELPGLQSDALVVYDSNGITHICSGSDRDTYFLQGWAHAQDRFFQMDTNRRT